MTLRQTAFEFFDACETGKGWAVCSKWCHDDATFSAQADALTDISSLAEYTEWTKGLLTPLPDGHYELMSFGVDEERGTVAAASVFHGTHTVDVGTGPPTGRPVAAEYCYVMEFEDGKIKHMTKIWNDVHSLKQLGWA